MHGEFEVDFQRLCSSTGLFAIVGATGSGKSTILDAICIALYHRTPRIKLISKATNDLMTKGADEMIAEVEFEVKNKIYRSFFGQKKSKVGKLQDPVVRLVDVSAGNVVLEDKVKEKKHRVEAITQLNFDRFTKSVLLAQGDFASFLKASASDKAELLEKLTGTSIYSKISKKVFDNFRDKEKKYNLKQEYIEGFANKILTDAEFETKQQQLRELQESEYIIRRKIKLVSCQQELKSAKAKEQQTRKAIIDIKKQIKQQQKIKQKKQQNLIKANHNMQRMRNSLITKIDFIDNQVVPLDNHIINLKKSISGKTKEQQQQAANLATSKQAVLNLEQKINAMQVQINQWQNDIKLYEQHQLVSVHAACMQDYKSFNKQTKQLQTLNKKIQQLEAKLAKQVAAIESKHHDLQEFSQQKNTIAASINNTSAINKFHKVLTDLELVRQQLPVLNKACNLARDFAQQQQTKANKLSLLDDLAAKSAQHKAHLAEVADIYNIHSEQDKKSAIKLITTAGHRSKHNIVDDLAIWFELTNACKMHAAQQETVEVSLQQLELSLIETQQDFIALALVDLKITNLTAIEAKLELQYQRYTQAVEALQSLHFCFSQQQQQLQDYHSLDSNTNSILLSMHDNNVSVNNDSAFLRELVAEKQIAEELINSAEQKILAAGKIFQCTESDVKAVTICLSNFLKFYEEHKQLLLQLQLKLDAARQDLLEQQFNVKSNIALEQKVAAQLQLDAEQMRVFKEKRQLLFQDQDCSLVKNEAIKQVEVFAAKLASQTKSIAIIECNVNNFSDNLVKLNSELETVLSVCESINKDLATTDMPIEVIDLTQLQDELKNNLTAQGGLSQVLEDNKKNKALLRDEEACLVNFRQDYHDSKQLSDLIGSQKGDKFRRYAQAITLDILLELTNNHLSILDNRYKLLRQEEAAKAGSLNVIIVDTWQAGAVRNIQNLSGGECFIVSLALALGLSELVGARADIDSLFIDEGFGCLDGQALDIAIDCLDRINSSGKMIGIISHVDALKERIGTQIQVIKKGNLGFSYIKK